MPRIIVRLACLALLAVTGAVPAQTPTPLSEWQLSAGEALLPYLSDEMPQWRGRAAAGAMVLPEYEGSRHSRVLPSGNLELRYRDLAYASTSEGLGFNALRGKGYRLGASVGLDLGRDDQRDSRLEGLGDVDPAPSLKLYAEKVFYPVVLRAAVQRIVADNAGWSLDLGVYAPLFGSKRVFLLAGPSVTLSDAGAMRRRFGVSAAQSARSGLPAFDPDGGVHAAGLGLSGTWLIDAAWFANATAASQWLLGDAQKSPLVTRQNQLTLSLIAGYRW